MYSDIHDHAEERGSGVIEKEQGSKERARRTICDNKLRKQTKITSE